MAFYSKYTGAEVEELLDGMKKGGITPLWNVYRFLGGDGDSVVVIDGEDVTVAAGATVQGTFTNDISAIPTNNLRSIIIRGDVSLQVGAYGTINHSVEEVDITFSPTFARSFYTLCGGLYNCYSVRIRGGKPTDAGFMCWGVGHVYGARNSPSVIDVSGVDWSECTDVGGFFYRTYCSSVSLSGANFVALTKTTAFFNESALRSIDLNGVLLPEDWTANREFVISLNAATLAPSLTGEFATIYGDGEAMLEKYALDLSGVDLNFLSVQAIFAALSNGYSGSGITWQGNIKLSSFSYLAMAGHLLAEDKGWTLFFTDTLDPEPA